MSFESYNPPKLSKRAEYKPDGMFYWEGDETISHICKNCGWAYGFHLGSKCSIPSKSSRDDLKDGRSDIIIYKSLHTLKTNIKTL